MTLREIRNILRQVLLLPGSEQFRRWSLPAKLAFISYIISLMGLLITLTVFGYQEIRSTKREPEIRDLLFPIIDCRQDSSKCMKIIKYKKNDFGFVDDDGELIVSSIILHRPNREFLVIGQDKTLHDIINVYEDRSSRNQKPVHSSPFVTDYLSRIEYVKFADGFEEGLLLVGVSGATGHFMELSLYTRTKLGYVDLFESYLSSIPNSFTVFQDIDGDGIDDLVTLNSRCEFEMYSLASKDSKIGYFPVPKSQEQIMKLLEKALVGSELLNVYQEWAKYDCRDTIEDGGIAWDEIDTEIQNARSKVEIFTDTIYEIRNQKRNTVFYSPETKALLLR